MFKETRRAKMKFVLRADLIMKLYCCRQAGTLIYVFIDLSTSSKLIVIYTSLFFFYSVIILIHSTIHF